LSAAVHVLALGIFSLWVLPSNEEAKTPPAIKIKALVQKVKVTPQKQTPPTPINVSTRKTSGETRPLPAQKTSLDIKTSPVPLQGSEALKKLAHIPPRFPVAVREIAATKMTAARFPATPSFDKGVAEIAPMELAAMPAHSMKATAISVARNREVRTQLLPLRSPQKIDEPSRHGASATNSKNRQQLSAHKNLAVHPVPHSTFQELDSGGTAQAVVNKNIFRAHPSPARPLPVESSSQMEALSGKQKPAQLHVAGIHLDTQNSVDLLQIAGIPPGFISEIPEGREQISSGHIDGLREGYSSKIWKRIAEVKYYPHTARDRGHEGQPVVAFTLENSGQLRDLTLVATSGHKTLDRAALEAVRDASPYPRIPDPLNLDSISFQLPISFILESP